MNNTIKVLLVILVPFSSSPGWGQGLDFQIIKNNLSGMCLDNLEAGCQGRHLPFRGLTIDFCEETCSLTNPVDINGINATSYDFECVADYTTPFLSRVLLISSNNQSGNAELMFVRSYFLRTIGSAQVSTSGQMWSVVDCY